MEKFYFLWENRIPLNSQYVKSLNNCEPGVFASQEFSSFCKNLLLQTGDLLKNNIYITFFSSCNLDIIINHQHVYSYIITHKMFYTNYDFVFSWSHTKEKNEKKVAQKYHGPSIWGLLEKQGEIFMLDAIFLRNCGTSTWWMLAKTREKNINIAWERKEVWGELKFKVALW